METKGFLLAAVIATATQLFGGGFFLELGNPEANPEAKAKHALVIVRATGCHDPAQAKIDGTATGVVDGKRRTIPLELTRLSAPGTFALTQQWPAKGRFAIALVGRNEGATTSLVVQAGENGIERKTARWFPRQPSGEEVDAALQ